MSSLEANNNTLAGLHRKTSITTIMTTHSQTDTPSLISSSSAPDERDLAGGGEAGTDADLRGRLCWLHSLFAAGEAGVKAMIVL